LHLKPRVLYCWYKNILSDYKEDIKSGKWVKDKIDIIDNDTGEIIKQKPVYIANSDNIGSDMTIDDKQIGKDTFTIMTNHKTGKIALLVETIKGNELKEAAKYLGDKINQIKNISSDMSPTYLKFCEEMFPDSTIIIDKFHVVKHVLEVLQSIRLKIKNQLLEKLPKGKKLNKENSYILSDLELLKRSKYLLMKSQSDWNDYQKEIMKTVFFKFNELKIAYNLTEKFKQWFDKSNCKKHRLTLEKELFKWYDEVENSKIIEFKSVIRLIEKHENRILNYFSNAITNAKAENMNAKIQRFIINNYGIRDKDFALYRIANYFS